MKATEPVLALHGLVPSAAAAADPPLTLAVAPGDLVALVLPSGPGARSLPRVILGLERAHAGTVRCFGTPVPEGPEAALVAMRRRIGWVPAQGALLSNLTLEGNLLLPLRYHEAPTDDRVQARAAETLALLELPPLPATIPPLADRTLCRRVALARALILRPELLLLEELTDGMDAGTARAVWATLARVCDQLGVATVALTGDAAGARGLTDRIIDRVHSGPSA